MPMNFLSLFKIPALSGSIGLYSSPSRWAVSCISALLVGDDGLISVTDFPRAIDLSTSRSYGIIPIIGTSSIDSISLTESKNPSSYHMFNTNPIIWIFSSLESILILRASATEVMVEFVTMIISTFSGSPSKMFELIPAGKSIMKMSPYSAISSSILFQDIYFGLICLSVSKCIPVGITRIPCSIS